MGYQALLCLWPIESQNGTTNDAKIGWASYLEFIPWIGLFLETLRRCIRSLDIKRKQKSIYYQCYKKIHIWKRISCYYIVPIYKMKTNDHLYRSCILDADLQHANSKKLQWWRHLFKLTLVEVSNIIYHSRTLYLPLLKQVVRTWLYCHDGMTPLPRWNDFGRLLAISRKIAIFVFALSSMMEKWGTKYGAQSFAMQYCVVGLPSLYLPAGA